MQPKDTIKKVILLVEDNPGHAELVKRSMARHPIANDLYHVCDGEEARDYLYRQNNYEDPQGSPRPDIILLDLRMPKIDGLEVLEEVKGEPDLQLIPIIVLTTSQADSDVRAAYKNRANSYLVKPVDFDNLTKMLHDTCNYWLHWNTHLVEDEVSVQPTEIP